ncbi:MAG: phosphohydrolase [Myxococcales bacterium]|nr:phosphohydrolase [Myxococcales bacterium]
MQNKDVIVIRDPIHGTLSLNTKEIRLVDQMAFQRLRNIKQLGFADQAFPGATHTRYGHSLGALHVASRLFDRLFRTGDLPGPVLNRFRQAVRLAILFHDIGHAPLSHTTEMLMPKVGELKLGELGGDKPNRQASHEDYTLKIILHSALGDAINKLFGNEGITPMDIVDLIHGQVPTTRYRYGGIDYAPVLRQLVSSEVDADRMDYLQRDSFYCGVSYGKFDSHWLIDNVTPVQKEGRIYLGIKSRAMFSFEDFLLSRYHMFASVYLHYTPVIFEKLLARYIEESDGEFALPADVEQYIQLDDVDLWYVLRRSKNPWAERIVARRPYALIDETDISLSDEDPQNEIMTALQAAGVDAINTRSRSLLSKYYGNSDAVIPIFVVTGSHNVMPLGEYTPLYHRYQNPSVMSHVYVDPEQKTLAKKIVQAVHQNRQDKGTPMEASKQSLVVQSYPNTAHGS